MSTININRSSLPLGPLRDKQVIDISSDDYINPRGFICQAVTAGDLTYRTLGGDVDQTESGLAIGDIINAGGIPVLLQSVLSTSTVTSIVIGIL